MQNKNNKCLFIYIVKFLLMFFSTNLVELKSLFLLQHAFKTITLHLVAWKKKKQNKKTQLLCNKPSNRNSWLPVLENTRNPSQKFTTKRLFWIFYTWQSPLLSWKVSGFKFATLLRNYLITNVSEWFFETFQNSPHWLHCLICCCQKIIMWLTGQTKTRQQIAWGTNKLQDNSSFTIANSGNETAC